ncbi:hypothetical protein GJ496_002034 [Pomphorhynchus laevis]|nr:hypothetical protein GJ496_002034 [Pomphorhynchus laevis]
MKAILDIGSSTNFIIPKTVHIPISWSYDLHDLTFPCNHKHLRRTLGLFSHYSKLVRDYFQLVQPLANVLNFPPPKEAFDAFELSHKNCNGKPCNQSRCCACYVVNEIRKVLKRRTSLWADKKLIELYEEAKCLQNRIPSRNFHNYNCNTSIKTSTKKTLSPENFMLPRVYYFLRLECPCFRSQSKECVSDKHVLTKAVDGYLDHHAVRFSDMYGENIVDSAKKSRPDYMG